MNKKSWCIVLLIVVFLTTSTLVTIFMKPWLVIIGFLLYTIMGYCIYELTEDEINKDCDERIQGLTKIVNTTMEQLQAYSSENQALQDELNDWKTKYKHLEDMRALNEQPKPKRIKKKVGE